MTVQKDQPGDACWGQPGVDGPGAREQEVSSWFGCAVLVFGSTRSFPGRQERGAAGGLPAGLASPCSFSVSLLWASAGERGAAGVWVLQHRHISLIYAAQKRSEPVNNGLLWRNKPLYDHPPICPLAVWEFQMFFKFFKIFI